MLEIAFFFIFSCQLSILDITSPFTVGFHIKATWTVMSLRKHEWLAADSLPKREFIYSTQVINFIRKIISGNLHVVFSK